MFCLVSFGLSNVFPENLLANEGIPAVNNVPCRQSDSTTCIKGQGGVTKQGKSRKNVESRSVSHFFSRLILSPLSRSLPPFLLSQSKLQRTQLSLSSGGSIFFLFRKISFSRTGKGFVQIFRRRGRPVSKLSLRRHVFKMSSFADQKLLTFNELRASSS